MSERERERESERERERMRHEFSHRPLLELQVPFHLSLFPESQLMFSLSACLTHLLVSASAAAAAATSQILFSFAPNVPFKKPLNIRETNYTHHDRNYLVAVCRRDHALNSFLDAPICSFTLGLS